MEQRAPLTIMQLFPHTGKLMFQSYLQSQQCTFTEGCQTGLDMLSDGTVSDVTIRRTRSQSTKVTQHARTSLCLLVFAAVTYKESCYAHANTYFQALGLYPSHPEELRE